ncbi:hypothetical protein [Sphingorhabdus contaminans]|uniref:hypothetical protein n=1 Tax=Sphingorhabdus contaminans TaxID=1343899 RepID=UPI003D2899F6
MTSPPATVVPGTYSNEEQAYFTKELGKAAVPVVMIRIDEKRRVESVDAFGSPGNVSIDKMTFSYNANTIEGVLPDGTKLELRRARSATCWVAVLKDKPKADGSPDWHFVRDIKLHDQGGRARVGGVASGAQEVIIRMRNVIWPPPTTNKPSIVLYIHKADQLDRAESYSWADPGAARIGINLRWMQASCGIDGVEAPSQVTTTTFRG